MAFRLAQKPTFHILVTVPVANDKGGYDKNTFMAEFKRASTTEMTELRKLTNEEVVRSQLVGWEMKDEDTKEDVPFSTVALEAALEVSPTPMYTAMAFWEGVNGARAKN